MTDLIRLQGLISVIVVCLRSLWLWHEKKKETNVFRLIQDCESGAPVTCCKGRRKSQSDASPRLWPLPFIKNSCYLKSLYPQHFFILSLEDLFYLPSFDHCSFSSGSCLHCESAWQSMHCWMETLRMSIWWFICYY